MVSLFSGKIIYHQDRSLEPQVFIRAKLTTLSQYTWLAKLIELDYTIIYKKGAENRVADALSRVSNQELQYMAFSMASSELLKQMRHRWESDFKLQQLVQKLKNGEVTKPYYAWQNNMLRIKGRLMVGYNALLKKLIMKLYHDSAQGGDSGPIATLRRINMLFY